MLWTWDQAKAAANRRTHGLSFEVAVHVFDDSDHISRPDIHPDGDRWQTIGRVGPVALLVVHTEPPSDAKEPVGRIISARSYGA